MTSEPLLNGGGKMPANMAPKRRRYGADTTLMLAGSDLDGRRRSARRIKEVIRQFTAAVGGNPQPHQVVLIQAVAELTAITEGMRASMLAGDHVDSNDLVRTHNTLLRAIDKLQLPASPPQSEDLESEMRRLAMPPPDADEADEEGDEAEPQ